LDVTGNVAVNTNKFNVTAASGNTTVGGTLGVTGKASFSGQLQRTQETITTSGAAADPNVATNHFTFINSTATADITGTLATPSAGITNLEKIIIIRALVATYKYDLTVTGTLKMPDGTSGTGKILRFTSAGQSANLIYDETSNAWYVTSTGVQIV
jgi:hypothetical protein